jgi:hypothetical protein
MESSCSVWSIFGDFEVVRLGEFDGGETFL